IYAFVTYIVFGFVYSLVNIPYGSLAAAMTQSTTERAKLASFRVIGSNLTILMLAFVVAPQIKGSTNLQQSLTITTLIFVAIVAAVCLFLAPPSVPAVAFACFLVLGVGLGLVNTLMWAFEADTVEYGEWTSGVRTEGITYAAFSFTRKMGQAVGGAAAAFTLGFGGYVAGVHVHQSSSALLSIRVAAGIIPAAFVLISIAIMAFYPLTET